MTVLRNHWGRRVVLAAIVAIAAALTVAPSGLKLQAAGMVFVVLFVVLALFKGVGSKKDAAQPAAVRGSGERRREAAEDGGGEEQQSTAPTRRGSAAAVQAEARVFSTDPVPPDLLRELIYNPPGGDPVIAANALKVLQEGLEQMAGRRLPLPRALQSGSGEQGPPGQPEIPEIKPRRK